MSNIFMAYVPRNQLTILNPTNKVPAPKFAIPICMCDSSFPALRMGWRVYDTNTPLVFVFCHWRGTVLKRTGMHWFTLYKAFVDHLSLFKRIIKLTERHLSTAARRDC